MGEKVFSPSYSSAILAPPKENFIVVLTIVFNKLQKKKIYGILIGIIFSIVIESLQTFTGRFVQLDDMLMNTLGTFIGYELWFLLSSVKLKENIYVK